jgi:replicative DNA helicase
MNSSQNWLIGQLAANPRLIHSVPVKPEWFDGLATQSLVRLMIKLDGDWLGEMDLIHKFTVEDKTSARHIDWHEIDQSQNFHFPLNSTVDTLQKQYTISQAQRAATAFATQPTDYNATTLIKAFEQMKTLDIHIKGDQLSGLVHEYVDSIQHPQEANRMIKTMPDVNMLLGGGISGGQLIIIGARPSTGKSAFAVNLIDGIQRNSSNMVIDLYSLEMTNQETRNRFISLMTRVPLGAVKSRMLTAGQKKAVEASEMYLKHSNIQIVDSAQRLDVITQSIRKRAATAQRDHYVAFIDYLGLVEPERPTGNRYQDVSRITRAFKVLANELDVPIVLLSQLNRENAKNKREPEMYDLRDSGSIEQDANVVIFLYQDDEDDQDDAHRQVIVKVAKNRDGARKKARFEFTPAYMAFREA